MSHSRSQLEMYVRNRLGTETPTVSPVTRRAAQSAILGEARTLREKVYRAIVRAGAQGMTAEELERELGMKGSTVRPRIVELREVGRIKESGGTRLTLSRRRAAVWISTGI